jgi:hypothetical protein
MTFSLSDLLKPASRDDMMTMLLEIATSLGLPTTAWQSGSVVRTILLLVAQKLSDLSNVNVEITSGGFGDFVSDAQAPLWAKETFNVDIVLAEPATGLINVTNSSASPYDSNPGELIVAHNVTGKTYRNQALIHIPASGSLNDIAIASDETGTGADAAPGTITVLVSNQIGVVPTNPLAVLGSDLETTPHLVARARTKLGSLSPMGAKDAYNFVATSLSATSTPITRTKVVADITTGDITVYLATANGAPSGGDVAIVQGQIDALAEPWCADATAVGATNHAIAVTYQAWVQGTSLTVPQIETLIANALATYMSAAPIGGYVVPPGTGQIFVEELSRVIHDATVGVVKVVVSLPASDVTLAANEVPTLGVVTPTVTLL